MLNTIQVMGRLGGDPEIKTSSKSDSKYVTFSLANTPKKDETYWFNCVAFNRTAQLIADYLKKGSMAIIEGNMVPEKYEKDGKTMTSWKLIAKRVHFLPSQKKTEEPSREAVGAGAVDDETPFF